MGKNKSYMGKNQSMSDNSKNSLNSNNGYQGVGNAGKQKGTQNQNK